MHLSALLLVFVVIFMAELPDKTVFTSILLSRRFPRWYVWLGAATAFLIHVIIAVTAGRLLTLLPHRLLESVIGLTFLTGSVLLFLGKFGFEPPATDTAAAKVRSASFWRAVSMSFGMVFLGEWGDITQIATANYAARYHDPIAVGIGATLALWSATGLGITVGAKALARVPERLLQIITGSILLLFAILSFASLAR